MSTAPGTAAWKRQYRAVIIGIRIDTRHVEKVWIQNDGGMSDGGRVHYPADGRTAAGEAMIVFGLTRFREFSISEGELAMDYSAALKKALDLGTPANDKPGPSPCLLPEPRIQLAP